MIIKRLLEPNQKTFWIAFLWTILIVYFSFKAPKVAPQIDFLFADKLVHFSFYFGFVFLWYGYFYFKNRLATKTKVMLVIAAIVMGGVIELGQGFLTVNRQADVSDAIANAMGAITGIGIANAFFKKYYSE
jgi:VanZ family protein